jgi:hypothetical protein
VDVDDLYAISGVNTRLDKVVYGLAQHTRKGDEYEVNLYRKIGSAFHAIHNSFGSRLERLTMPQEQIDLLNLATAEVEAAYEALICRIEGYNHYLDAMRKWLEAPEYVIGDTDLRACRWL